MTTKSLRQLRKEAATCKACDLWERGTQTVFGAGDERAGLMLVGEQPGDREDLTGLPLRRRPARLGRPKW